jgi:hypothetical protein
MTLRLNTFDQHIVTSTAQVEAVTHIHTPDMPLTCTNGGGERAGRREALLKGVPACINAEFSVRSDDGEIG